MPRPKRGHAARRFRSSPPPRGDWFRRAPHRALDRRASGLLPVTKKARPETFDWLRASGHPHRVEIVRHFLAAGTDTTSDMAKVLGHSESKLRYHVGVLTECGILTLTGKTQRRGAATYHYQLTDRGRVVSFLWGADAELLVTDFERENGRGDASVRLDSQALAEWRELTAAYLARLGELGLQTRDRAAQNPNLTKIAILLATDDRGANVRPEWT